MNSLALPPTTPFRPGDDLNPRHRTVSDASANTVDNTAAYQPPTKADLQDGRHRTVKSLFKKFRYDGKMTFLSNPTVPVLWQ